MATAVAKQSRSRFSAEHPGGGSGGGSGGSGGGGGTSHLPPDGPNARKIGLIKAAMERVPLNSFNLPEGYYRSDLIPDELVPNELEPQVDSPASTYPVHAVEQGKTIDQEVSSPEGGDVVDEGNLAGESRPSSQIPAPLPLKPSLIQPQPKQSKPKQDLREQLSFAYVPLMYVEGFPTLPDGRPFWAQLEFEPPDSFRMFELYLSQGRYGARQLFSLLPHLEGGRRLRAPFIDPPLTGAGQLDFYSAESESESELDPVLESHIGLSPTLAPSTGEFSTSLTSGQALQCLHEAYYLYYWEVRARAYDLFYAASVRKAREMQALGLEEDHYIKATRLMNLLNEKVLNSEEFWSTMSPKVAIDFLKTLTAWQRMSVGLPANGPAAKDAGENNGQSFELILRNLAKGATPPSLVAGGSTAGSESAALDLLLQNPETAAVAQELVIRLNTPQSK